MNNKENTQNMWGTAKAASERVLQPYYINKKKEKQRAKLQKECHSKLLSPKQMERINNCKSKNQKTKIQQE